MPDTRLLPAHGPIAESVHARVDELAAHHEARLALCRSAVASGLTTSAEVATVLPWTRRERRLDELHVFDKMLAVLETRAHLELLCARGDLVSATAADTVVTYAVESRVNT